MKHATETTTAYGISRLELLGLELRAMNVTTTQYDDGSRALEAELIYPGEAQLAALRTLAAPHAPRATLTLEPSSTDGWVLLRADFAPRAAALFLTPAEPRETASA